MKIKKSNSKFCKITILGVNIILFIVSVGYSQVFAQPGSYPAYINVVTSKGEPVRDAWVNVIPTSNGIRGSLFERTFLPTDGSHSKFSAYIYGRQKGKYEIEVNATGYNSVRETILFGGTMAEAHNIILERNISVPLPELPPLVTLSGRITNTFGEPMRGLEIQEPSGNTFVAESDKTGRYSIKVVPGIYRLVFHPPSCTSYTIEDFIIDREDKVFNLVTECKYRRGN